MRTICSVMNEVEAAKTMLSLHIFLTIPVTTCTGVSTNVTILSFTWMRASGGIPAERTFSSLRHLKTFLQSTMTQPRLNNLTIMYVHRDKTEQLNILNIAEKFVCENSRRKTFLVLFKIVMLSLKWVLHLCLQY